jgi:hypothetical protein
MNNTYESFFFTVGVLKPESLYYTTFKTLGKRHARNDKREGSRRLVTLARLRNIILWRFLKTNMPDLYPTPYSYCTDAILQGFFVYELIFMRQKY